MNNAFRFLIILVFVLQPRLSGAQNFGIKGGMNLATMLLKDNNGRYSDNFSTNSGIHFGFIFEFPLNNIVSITPEILLTSKGMKYDFKEADVKTSSDMKLYYIDFPVMIKARWDWSKDMKIFGATGPYLGAGANGKSQTTTITQEERICEKKDVKWGSNDNDDLTRMDWGWTFAGGLQVEKVELGISYDVGFANISANKANGTITRNRVVRASIAYQFGK